MDSDLPPHLLAPLVTLPFQPDDVAWPTADPDGWPTGEVPDGVDLDGVVGRLFDAEEEVGTTFAVVVVHRGRLVAERYAGFIEHWDRPAEPVVATTALHSWSMAKSFLHAAVGVAVGDGLLDPGDPAGIASWTAEPDDRSGITLEHLLTMRDGLDFVEDYVDAGRSDVIDMLFGPGADDMAAFAADRLLVAPPGDRFNYSSGTSNIVSSILARAVGSGESTEAFLRQRVLDPIGFGPARLVFDAASTWVASSYVYATARDYARFGLLHLRDGTWDGQRVLPEGWVDHGRRARSVEVDTGEGYGAHWWASGDDLGSFRAAGYEGQTILMCPALDLVAVRLGKTPADLAPNLATWRRDLLDAFRSTL